MSNEVTYDITIKHSQVELILESLKFYKEALLNTYSVMKSVNDKIDSLDKLYKELEP